MTLLVVIPVAGLPSSLNMFTEIAPARWTPVMLSVVVPGLGDGDTLKLSEEDEINKIE